ncbi:hypothetical protein ACEZCY_04290 [Streptacidiphilus sp. N1-12]|uniref:Uncharacterized protein n=2 Tax=Streptacidiphilus alkalitolerans TaxID=3342712 RepID=A0ABV6W8P8_9ACTN
MRSVAVLGIAVALGTWISGPGRHAAQVRSLWSSGIDATRHSARSSGMRLGPVGRAVLLAVTVLQFLDEDSRPQASPQDTAATDADR